MSRRLHLIDAASRQASPTTLALLADSLGPDDRVLLLGGAPLARDAEAAGLVLTPLPPGGAGGGSHGPPNASVSAVATLGSTPLPPREGQGEGRRSPGLHGFSGPQWKLNPPLTPPWEGGESRLVTRLSVPGGRAVLGFPAVRRRLREERFDAVCAWSLGAAALASLQFPKAQHTLRLTLPPLRETRPLLRRLVARSAGRLTIHTISDALRDDVIDAGVPESAVVTVPPMIDAGRFNHADRAALRRDWFVDDATRVVALLGDPPAAGDSRHASLAIGLANESLGAALGRETPIRLVMHPGQDRRASAWQMMIAYGVGHLVAQDARVAAPWQVLPACDAALLIGQSAASLSLRWALAAGIPVVAESVPGVEEAVADHPHVLLAEPGQPKRLAHRLHQTLLALETPQTALPPSTLSLSGP